MAAIRPDTGSSAVAHPASTTSASGRPVMVDHPNAVIAAVRSERGGAARAFVRRDGPRERKGLSMGRRAVRMNGAKHPVKSVLLSVHTH